MDKIGFVPDEDLGFEADKTAEAATQNMGFKPELELETAFQKEKDTIKQQQFDRIASAKAEQDFQSFYAPIAKTNKLDLNPDAPANAYDFRGLFQAVNSGFIQPLQINPATKQFKLPADFTLPGHPDFFIKQDPDTWTLEQTEKFFKDNPASTPEQEAQYKVFLDQKKEQLAKIEESLTGYDRHMRNQANKMIAEGKEYAHVELLTKPDKMSAFESFEVPYVKGVAGFFTRPFGVEPLGSTFTPEEIKQSEKDHPIASSVGKAIGGIGPIAVAVALAPETLLGQLFAFATTGAVGQYGAEKTQASLMDKEESRNRIIKSTLKSAAYAPLWYYTQGLTLGGPVSSILTRAGSRGAGGAAIEKAGGASNQEAVMSGLMTGALSGLFELTPYAIDKINTSVKNRALDDMAETIVKNDDDIRNAIIENYTQKNGIAPSEEELTKLIRAGLTIEVTKNNIPLSSVLYTANKLRKTFEPKTPEIIPSRTGEKGQVLIPFSEGDIVQVGNVIGKISKIAGDNAIIVSTLGKQFATQLKNIQPTGLTPQDIPEDHLTKVPENKKEYIKELFKIENPNVVDEFIHNDPQYQSAIKRNKQLGNKIYIQSDDPQVWPEYYNKYLKKAIRSDVAPAQGQPEVIIWMGLPGSGKSAMAKAQGLDKTHIQIDPDDAKTFIPETAADPALADYVHKESAYMADELLLQQALEQNKNIIWPLVGKNPQKVAELIQRFKDAGYKVELNYNRISTVESKKRAYKRFLEDKRLVSNEYIDSVGDLTLDKNYATLKERADKYASWDVNTKFGETPRELDKGASYGETGTQGGGQGRSEIPARAEGPGESQTEKSTEKVTGSKSTISPSQKEQVKSAVSEIPKTIKEIAEETNILEPNIRRILGVGTKDGTFTRLDKGVYILNKNGKDIAYIHTGDSVETLPALAKQGFKADMIFLDIPYKTPAVIGGNRGIKYEYITPAQFQTVVKSVAQIVRDQDTPVLYMYSQAKSGLSAMKQYTDVILKHFKPVAKGEYTKLQKDGITRVRNMRGDIIEPEGILLLTQSGNFDKENPDLNFKLIRPRGYQTEKPAEMMKSLIELTTEKGEVVLDPFSGSGVTLAEAVKSGRVGVGIEKNADVVADIILPRIREAAKSIPEDKNGRNLTEWENADLTLPELQKKLEILSESGEDADTIQQTQEDIVQRAVKEISPAEEEIPPDENLVPEEEVPGVIEQAYNDLTPEERAQFELDMDDLRKTPEGNLFIAIKQLGGIRPYTTAGSKSGTKYMAEELKSIPFYLKNKRSAHTLDSIVSELAAYGWHFENGEELREEISKQATHPVQKVDRASLQKIIQEANKNRKLQQTILDKVLPGKRRKFITTVKRADKTSPEVSQKIESRYDPISNEETLKQAQDFVNNSYNDAIELVEGPSRTSTFANAVGIVLIDKAQAEGRFADAIRLVERLAEKNTELGQAIQALSMYERLTPEGILQYAEKQVQRAREDIKQKERLTNYEKIAKTLTSQAEKDKLAEKLGIPHISEIVAGELRKMAEMVQDMPPGRERSIQEALLLKKIADQIPSNLWQKVSMIQTMMQLLNPKTFIRNILGNVGFQALENISDTLGTVLDIAASLTTGKRTTYLPDMPLQLQGLTQGMKEGTQEALLGVNLKGGLQSKYTLPKNGVFDTGVMGAFEKTLRISLSATDRAFYQAAFNQSIRNQCRASGVEEPTPEMIEQAHLSGLYKTFQDDNVISNFFTGLKRLLNLNGDFGLGDIVIKYPKTPASILARGIEYSPLYTAKVIWLIGKAVLKKGFNQEDFIKTFSRMLTGSALLVGTGWILGKMGIISGRRAKDKDVAATRAGVGIREYQINASALKRFVMSGMSIEASVLREDDELVSYDWFLPSSIGLAMGADLALNPKENLVDKTLNLGDKILQASETLQQQPLVQGLRVLTSKQNLAEGISDVLQGVPASFVPTLLNQVRQLTDNTVRNTKDPDWFKETYKKAIYRIPGLSSTLPETIDPLGKPKEMYQLGSNNPFNVFLNPAFVNKYKPDTVSKMVLDIWENTGETVQFPRVAQTKIKLGTETKEPVELTPNQYLDYQRYIGYKTNYLFNILANNEKFMALPDEQKAKKLQGYLTDINTAAKTEILGYRPKHISHDVIAIIKNIGYDKKQMDRQPQGEDLGFSAEEDLGFVAEK